MSLRRHSLLCAVVASLAAACFTSPALAAPGTKVLDANAVITADQYDVGWRIVAVDVSAAPGVRIGVACRPQRVCADQRSLRAKKRLTTLGRLRGKTLRPGDRLTINVTRRGFVGHRTVFVVRRQRIGKIERSIARRRVADADRDGIGDAIDACPAQPGVPPKGCPRPGPSDGDGDGVSDDLDRCPAEAGAAPTGCPARATDPGPGPGSGPGTGPGATPSDRDGDGISDATDKCPSDPGVAPDGCSKPTTSDRDGDGVPDAEDSCPTVAGPAPTGCQQTTQPPGETPPAQPKDSDGDGVVDGQDGCPTTPGSPSHGGCPPPPDSDGDGVIDANDSCASHPGPAPSGCPPAPACYNNSYNVKRGSKGTYAVSFAGTVTRFEVVETNFVRDAFAFNGIGPNGYFQFNPPTTVNASPARYVRWRAWNGPVPCSNIATTTLNLS